MSKEEQSMMDSTLGDKRQWSMVSNAKANVATDDHLQNLGFDVNDGLPKFKLNEPGPAALASSIFQINNMVNDETEQSFVVLGQSSLDCVRETTLSKYVEIQNKSMSNDRSSSISMMSPIEIEESLKKVLDENLKLKETLRQNNTTIKEQFSTITKWQKEVMAVCDNHKQKFIETKELINKLKNENDELREKITKNESANVSISSDAATGFSLDNNSMNSIMKKLNYVSTENVSAMCSINSSITEVENKTQSNSQVLENEQELVEKIDMLSDELITVKSDHSKLQEMFDELEKRYISDIQLFSQQLQKANKGLEDFKKCSGVSDASELQELVNKCCQKDNEIKDLRDLIKSLDHQICIFEENAFTLFHKEIDTSDESNKEKILFKENVEFYNEKINDLKKCFASQCSRYVKIQEFLKESSQILQCLESEEILPNIIIPADKLQTYKDKLCTIRKKLTEEQLQSIEDKLTTIKIQRQFQNILSDFYDVVYELEILRNEHSKLVTLQVKEAEENSYKLAAIEKHLREDKKMLDDEKAALHESVLNVQIEKKLISDEREKLQTEQTNLSIEKEKLAEEKISLTEERTSLDRQSKLYEAEEGTLQKEKKTLQKKCEDLNNEIVKLKQELNLADVTMQRLRADNIKLKENEELISVYKIQTEMYQKEFDEMRITQQNLQEQLQSLSMTNIELRTENDRLGGSVSNEDAMQQQQPQEQRPTRSEASSSRINSNWITCPKCKDLIPINHVASHFNVCYHRSNYRLHK